MKVKTISNNPKPLGGYRISGAWLGYSSEIGINPKEKLRRSLSVSSLLYLMVRSQYVAHITALVNASTTPRGFPLHKTSNSPCVTTNITPRNPIIIPIISRMVILWLSNGMERITTMRGHSLVE